VIRRFTSGDTIPVGSPVYVSANETVSLADASAVGTGACIGVAVANNPNGASATSIVSGEMCDVVLFGPVAGYSTNMAAGTIFYVDDDAGVIANATGTKTTIIGVGLSGAILLVNPGIISVS